MFEAQTQPTFAAAHTNDDAAVGQVIHALQSVAATGESFETRHLLDQTATPRFCLMGAIMGKGAGCATDASTSGVTRCSHARPRSVT